MLTLRRSCILLLALLAITITRAYENNCYRKNLCYGKSDNTSLCATTTTLVNCAGWSDYPTNCPNGCTQKSDSVAECHCLNDCSGVGTCTTGTCKCPAGYSGDDCGVKSICQGISGSLCINNTFVNCYQQQPWNSYSCSLGCTSLGCICPRNCSGYPCRESGTCQCPSDRTGADCSVVNPCTSGANDFRCLNSTMSVYCSGTYMYQETNCQYGCSQFTGKCQCATLCTVHGTCRNGDCECDYGYTGADCYTRSECYTQSGVSHCKGNARYYCSSSYSAPTITNCTSTCEDTYGYAQCTCNCDTERDAHANCQNDGSCACAFGWSGPHCWTITLAPQTSVCSMGDGTYCNGTHLITCSSGYVRSIYLCPYGCSSNPLAIGMDKCACPVGLNGQVCSGRGSCSNGQCSCDDLDALLPDCSPNPCAQIYAQKTICSNNYTTAYCSAYRTMNTAFCPGGCTSAGNDAQCNYVCGPHGSSTADGCTCEKGYRACPLGFGGDDCSVLLSVCSLLNDSNRPTAVCEGDTIVNCVHRVPVSTERCAEGCLSAQCICNRENNCSGHGTCLGGVCTCQPGWTGPLCDQQDVLYGACDHLASGEYCHRVGGTNTSGTIVTCFRGLVVGNAPCPGGCDEQTHRCTCPFNCHRHGRCYHGECYCSGEWFGQDCKYSGFTIALQVIGATGLLSALLVGYYVMTSYKHRAQTFRLDQERKTDYDFSDEEVVLLDSNNVDGYQSMSRNVFKKMFKK